MEIQERLSTGLHDSNGKEIFVGDVLKREVTVNREVHGDWSLVKVVVRGLTPCILYVRSQKGNLLPEGYTGSLLADCYDPKMLLFMDDVADLSPNESLLVVTGMTDAETAQVKPESEDAKKPCDWTKCPLNPNCGTVVHVGTMVTELARKDAALAEAVKPLRDVLKVLTDARRERCMEICQPADADFDCCVICTNRPCLTARALLAKGGE